MATYPARSRFAFVMIALIVVAGTAGGIMVSGQTARPMAILSRAPVAAPRSAPALDPWERRVRQVSLNASAFPTSAAADQALASNGQVSIDLFDGASVTAVLDRYDPNETGVTWVGHVPGQSGSLVTIVSGGGALAASIILNDASYTIRPAPRDAAAGPDGTYFLVQTNGAGFMREAPPIEITPTADEAAAAADQAMADAPDFIDVLIAYTALAETWAGGTSGIINWINVGVSETNSAYAASGISQRIRLVHTVRVAYTEVNSFNTNLTNLRGGAAVGLENVAALRNSYTADLVSLLVHPLVPDACGIAFLMTTINTSFAPSGFSVVDAPCVSPNATLAHELGHNMGLRHDWYVDAGLSPFTWAHGYVDTTARFRTIMAYPDACTALGFSCTRLLQFSNPDLTYLGRPGGIAGGTKISCPSGSPTNIACDADERRVLNDTAPTVANFRLFSTDRPPTIVSHPQSQSKPRGQALTLQVAADGLGPLTYQWYRGLAPLATQPIPGATGSSYTFTPGADGVWFERWFYWVQVKNPIGSDDSFTATVTLLPPASAATSSRRETGVPAVTLRGHGGTSTTLVNHAVSRPSASAAVLPAQGGHPQDVSVTAAVSESSPCQAATSDMLLAGLRRLSVDANGSRAVLELADLINKAAELNLVCAAGREER